MASWEEFLAWTDDPHDEVVTHIRVCSRHMVYSSYEGARCFVCEQERRKKIFQEQKSGVYYERELGYNPNQIILARIENIPEPKK
jgi:hypothetical protein